MLYRVKNASLCKQYSFLDNCTVQSLIIIFPSRLWGGRLEGERWGGAEKMDKQSDQRVQGGTGEGRGKAGKGVG